MHRVVAVQPVERPLRPGLFIGVGRPGPEAALPVGRAIVEPDRAVVCLGIAEELLFAGPFIPQVQPGAGCEHKAAALPPRLPGHVKPRRPLLERASLWVQAINGRIRPDIQPIEGLLVDIPTRAFAHFILYLDYVLDFEHGCFPLRYRTGHDRRPV